YNAKHASPGLLKEAVYGIPELNREKIKTARLVANPGCYPTGAILAATPIVENFKLAGGLIVDSESGTSGAGAEPKPHVMFSEISGNVYPYGIGTHRHTPEMSQYLPQKGTAKPTSVLFAPSIIPVVRGISTTVYARLANETSQEALLGIFEKRYSKEPFVRLVKQPSINAVAGSNYCDMSVHYDPGSKTAVIVSAIDNLVKGASGTAQHEHHVGLWRERGLVAIFCQAIGLAH
ncbi:MAG TPA: N-acetyl-gamma-glutamyl-phosphate reductase, partial [Candidatus Micrarchaeota archaeon]|nr:N-acetyl-gamma-glutamyl-phosphate reductase [Candidatus Micrarchaeota archaeon]